MSQVLRKFSSKHQLFAAIAEWLQLPIIPLDEVPSTSIDFIPVAFILSHEFWFDYFALPLVNEIGLELDSQVREWRLQKILIIHNKST